MTKLLWLSALSAVALLSAPFAAKASSRPTPIPKPKSTYVSRTAPGTGARVQQHNTTHSQPRAIASVPAKKDKRTPVPIAHQPQSNLPGRKPARNAGAQRTSSPTENKIKVLIAAPPVTPTPAESYKQQLNPRTQTEPSGEVTSGGAPSSSITTRPLRLDSSTAAGSTSAQTQTRTSVLPHRPQTGASSAGDSNADTALSVPDFQRHSHPDGRTQTEPSGGVIRNGATSSSTATLPHRPNTRTAAGWTSSQPRTFALPHRPQTGASSAADTNVDTAVSVPDFQQQQGPGPNGVPLPRRPQSNVTLLPSENPNPKQASTAFKQLPDLTPTDMRINKDGQLEVFVQNKGFGPSPECNLGIKYFYPKGEPYSELVGPSENNAGIPALQKDESAWVTDPNIAVWGYSIPVQGADKVVARVDPEKWDNPIYDGGAQVKELRKDNNELIRATLIIPGTGSTSSPAQSHTSVLPQRPQTGSSPPIGIKTNTPVSVPDVPPYKPLPDLVVTDMKIDAEGFLHVRVENKGVGAAAECFLMMVPGEYQGNAEPFSYYNVPQLGKGEGVWVKMRSPHAKQISVTVDPLIDYDNGYDDPVYIDPQVEELHEDNNVFTLEISP